MPPSPVFPTFRILSGAFLPTVRRFGHNLYIYSLWMSVLLHILIVFYCYMLPVFILQVLKLHPLCFFISMWRTDPHNSWLPFNSLILFHLTESSAQHQVWVQLEFFSEIAMFLIRTTMQSRLNLFFKISKLQWPARLWTAFIKWSAVLVYTY